MVLLSLPSVSSVSVCLQLAVSWANGPPGVNAAPPVAAVCQLETRQLFKSENLVGCHVLDPLYKHLSVTPTAACLVTNNCLFFHRIENTFRFARFLKFAIILKCSCVTVVECPVGQMFNECSGSCPHICEDLWPHTQCIVGPCTPGCMCPHGQVRILFFNVKFSNFCTDYLCSKYLAVLQLLYDGSCVPHAECPCSPLSLPADYQNITAEKMTEPLFPPGTTIQQLCNTWWYTIFILFI